MKNRYISFVTALLLLGAMFISTCNCPPAPPPAITLEIKVERDVNCRTAPPVTTTKITVKVRDAVTGAPVIGVPVTISPMKYGTVSPADGPTSDSVGKRGNFITTYTVDCEKVAGNYDTFTATAGAPYTGTATDSVKTVK